MRLLLDTHALLWFYLNDSSLSLDARKAIEDADNERFISIASLWEIGLLTQKGRLTWSRPLDHELDKMVTTSHASLCPILPTHVSHAAVLPPYHKDPFDRMLIAQAITEQLTLVSCDRTVARYSVALMW